MMTEELLETVACPLCKGELAADAMRSYLLCQTCGLEFPVRDGIPILLREEAELVS